MVSCGDFTGMLSRMSLKPYCALIQEVCKKKIPQLTHRAFFTRYYGNVCSKLSVSSLNVIQSPLTQRTIMPSSLASDVYLEGLSHSFI